MDRADWKRRAYDAGLTNARLAELLGMARPSLSRAFNQDSKRGLSRYVKTVIVAWALLSPEARLQLIAEAMDEPAQEGAAAAKGAGSEA